MFQLKAVYEKLNVKSIADLKGAIKDGSFAGLPGFGDKKAAAIARGIAFLEKSSGRIRLDQAIEAAELVGGFLRDLSGIQKLQSAGSLRRRAETIGDVDILVAVKGKGSGKAGGQIIQAFTSAGFVREVLASGSTKGSAIIQTPSVPVHVDVRVVPQESFGAAAQYFTGSKEHNIRLREIAIQKKMKLSEYGLFKKTKRGTERRVEGKTEEEIYTALGIPYIPPVIREDTGEIETAKKHELPALVTSKHIKGDLHFHSDWSDGVAGLEEIAAAGRRKGYSYILISDHSKSLHIAHGLSEERLKRQIGPQCMRH